MNAVSIGPVVMDAARLAGVGALLLFLVVSEIAARFQRTAQAEAAASRWTGLALFGWLLAARAGFVAANWPDYAARPMDVLRLWQGGFLPAAGWAVGGAIVLFAFLRGARGAVRPVVLGGIAALLMQGAVAAAFPPPTVMLPRLQMTDLDGGAVPLVVRDRPVVLNLWATWCPPCRREMPMMTELAAGTPQVDFIFANQGDSVAQVRAFLKGHGLSHAGMVRDPRNRLMAELDAVGLPATLVFDARGRLVGAHTGEISRAALSRMIARAAR